MVFLTRRDPGPESAGVGPEASGGVWGFKSLQVWRDQGLGDERETGDELVRGYGLFGPFVRTFL